MTQFSLTSTSTVHAIVLTWSHSEKKLYPVLETTPHKVRLMDLCGIALTL
jgi:hypothetical protein